jgi:hypothetical protein
MASLCHQQRGQFDQKLPMGIQTPTQPGDFSIFHEILPNFDELLWAIERRGLPKVPRSIPRNL